MRMIRNTVVAAGLAAALAACGSEAVEPPPASPSSSSTPSPSLTAPPTPTPPVMPEAAKAHTEEGAKAFVVYYWQVVDYVQQTLDTTPLELLSDASCVGCQAGIKAMKKLARKNARLVGGDETVSALRPEHVKPGRSVLVAFDLTNEPQQVLVPGKKPLLHPGGTTKKLMALLPRNTGWIAGELRSRS